jgi:hypothetical protein
LIVESALISPPENKTADKQTRFFIQWRGRAAAITSLMPERERCNRTD